MEVQFFQQYCRISHILFFITSDTIVSPLLLIVLVAVTKTTKLVNLATSIRRMLIIFTVNQNKIEAQVAFVKEICETGVM
jgi:hypothetical protein